MIADFAEEVRKQNCDETPKGKICFYDFLARALRVNPTERISASDFYSEMSRVDLTPLRDRRALKGKREFRRLKPEQYMPKEVPRHRRNYGTVNF